MPSLKRGRKRSAAMRRSCCSSRKAGGTDRRPTTGIADLEDAGQFATRVQFYRIEADAMYELAKLYRDAGDLSTADARATQGVTQASRLVIVIMCLAI